MATTKKKMNKKKRKRTRRRNRKCIGGSTTPDEENIIVSIIVTHQNRIRCLLSELLNQKVHRFKNAAIVKLIINNIGVSVKLVHDGELSKPPKGRKYYTLEEKKTVDNYNQNKTQSNKNNVSDFFTTQMKSKGGSGSERECYDFKSYNDNSNICASGTIKNAIKINGDGKCGWYSIFVYLKLLYLHHIDHFEKSDVLIAIKTYFDKNNDIFIPTDKGLAVENNHFINMINILGLGTISDIDKTIIDDNNIKKTLINYRSDNKILKQFDFINNSSFIRKNILAPMYLIDNTTDINDQFIRHTYDSEHNNDSYDIPPLIMFRNAKDNIRHFDLIDNVTNKEYEIYSDTLMTQTGKDIKIDYKNIDLEQLNRTASSETIPIAYPFQNECKGNNCTIHVTNITNKLVELAADNNKEYHFYLVRHGEAEHNLYNRYNIIRKYDTSLTEDGEKQASGAGDALKNMKIKPNYIFVSDLKRTHQTLETMYHIYKETNPDVIVLPCAHELKYKKGRKSRKGYCDRSWDYTSFITKENKTSCKKIDDCNQTILDKNINWNHYDSFYNGLSKKRNTRRTSKNKCKNTNMIEKAIKIINNK